MDAYFAELAQRFPGGFDPGDALDEAATAFNPPMGVFVLALANGQSVGCGATQFLDAHTAEIKRMWVSPAYRGRGVGRQLLTRLESEARVAGRTRVLLDTNGTLTEAIAMYGSQGYVPVERYNDNPYAQHWFEKLLPDPTPSGVWAAVTVDCGDPRAVAGFWGELLGATPRETGLPGWYRIGPFVDGGPVLTFQPVPEPRIAKVRLHLDVRVDDLEVAIDGVVRHGGAGPTALHHYAEGTVAVMADPEGNEFCLVALAPGAALA